MLLSLYGDMFNPTEAMQKLYLHYCIDSLFKWRPFFHFWPGFSAGETVHAGLRAHKYWTAGYFTETQKGDKALGLSESKHIFQSCKNKNKTKIVNVFTGRRHNDNAKDNLTFYFIESLSCS